MLKHCEFRVTEDALLVANIGKHFDRRGVISICSTHLTVKGQTPPVSFHDEVPDGQLVECIRENALQVYQLDPNRMWADYGHEKEIRRDYGGRALWELLQNVDDAMAPGKAPSSQLIGAKGIGFKSVLEITDEPEVHSPPFHFCFSPTQTQQALRKRLRGRFTGETPRLTFWIPHDKPDPDPAVRALLREYDTVIRLPFRDPEAKSSVCKWLEKLDGRILLFCQNIQLLEVFFPDGTRRSWRVHRRGPVSMADGDILLEEHVGEEMRLYRFRQWAECWQQEGYDKRLSAAICLQVDDSGRVIPLPDQPPLHVFFPTEEFLPFHALVHASFELDQSRKHVRASEIDQPIFERLRKIFSRLLKTVPAESALQAFVPKHDLEADSLAHRLWGNFEEVLRNTAFVPCIGGRRVAPPDVTLWSEGLGSVVDPDAERIKGANLLKEELAERQECNDALRRLGAQSLAGERYPELLAACRNKTYEHCKAALGVLWRVIKDRSPANLEDRREFLEKCRQVPCWWTEQGRARPLQGRVPLLRKPASEPLPEWLCVDVLDPSLEKYFAELEQKLEGDPADEHWRKLHEHHLVVPEKQKLLDLVLVPTLADQTEERWWETHGPEVLALYKAWYGGSRNFEEIEPLVLDYPRRNNETDRRKLLGAALRLPTEKGWLPAAHCYAGPDWDCLMSFDGSLEDIKDRGVLLPPSEWPIDVGNDKQTWKAMLRYAGVSWEPKLLHWRCLPGEEKGFYGSPPNPWEDYRCWDYWNDYCGTLNPGTYDGVSRFCCNARLREQWALEFFPQCMPEDAQDCISVIKPLVALVKDQAKHMRFMYERSRSRKFSTASVDSLAYYEVFNFSWLPCRPALLHGKRKVAPREAYLPGKGLYGLLPEVDVRIENNQRGRELATFLVDDLKVRESMPGFGDPLWEEWLKRLPEAAADAEIAAKYQRAIRELYKKFLQIGGHPSSLPPAIPCELWDLGEGKPSLRFLPPHKVYWLDEPHLAEPEARKELGKRFPLFILELDAGKEAVHALGVTRLSDVVTVEPDHEDVDEKHGRDCAQRYRQRHAALLALSRKERLNNLPKPGDFEITAVRELRLKIVHDGETIAAPQVSMWVNDDGSVLVDSSRPLRGLALAVVSLSQRQQREFADNIENILREDDMTGVLRRLRELGVSEAALKDVEAEMKEETVLEPGLEPEVKGADETKQSPEEVSAEEETAHAVTVSRSGVAAKEKSAHASTSASASPHGQTSDTPGIARTAPGNHWADGGGSEAANVAGRKAEEWLRTQLRASLQADGWSVSPTAERDDQSRETDIVLIHRQRGMTYHIEVKRVQHGRVYWSEAEVNKAKDHEGRYFMALLRPQGYVGNYIVNWLWAPLKQLSDLPRTGVWIWQTREENVPLPEEPWKAPQTRPQRQPSNFSFRIEMDTDYIDGLPRGLDALRQKLNEGPVGS